MRPRIFHELSRCLALRFENVLDAGQDSRLPVYLCHPVEVLEREAVEAHVASGVLYLFRIDPARDHSRAPVEFRQAAVPGARHTMVTAGLAVRLRFAFVVVGGTQEEELCILAALLDQLHGRPWVEMDELFPNEDYGRDDTIPISLLSEPDAWREIGLEEHRLMVVFEAQVPLGGRSENEVGPILERDLDVKVRFPSGGAS